LDVYWNILTLHGPMNVKLTVCNQWALRYSDKWTRSAPTVTSGCLLMQYRDLFRGLLMLSRDPLLWHQFIHLFEAHCLFSP